MEQQHTSVEAAVELLPCPFCGNAKVSLEWVDDYEEDVCGVLPDDSPTDDAMFYVRCRGDEGGCEFLPVHDGTRDRIVQGAWPTATAEQIATACYRVITESNATRQPSDRSEKSLHPTKGQWPRMVK